MLAAGTMMSSFTSGLCRRDLLEPVGWTYWRRFYSKTVGSTFADSNVLLTLVQYGGAMKEIDTGVVCVVCRQVNVVARVESVPIRPLIDIPIGPASENYFRKEISFHCPSCGVRYEHPPNKPEAAAEILRDLEKDSRLEEVSQTLKDLRKRFSIDQSGTG
jgi:hypothetical protein